MFQKCDDTLIMVARWYFFVPKIPIWVYLGRLGLENVGILDGHMENVTATWNILRSFGIFLK
jgi:hypothetical protein